jgi:hypothetical protein
MNKTRKESTVTGFTNDIAWKNKYVAEETSLNVIGLALDP